MSKSRGVFQILGGWMTSRGQCPRGGGGACGYLCKISGKSTPLPPLTKAFPYAYVARVRVKVRFRVSYILFKPKWAVGLLGCRTNGP